MPEPQLVGRETELKILLDELRVPGRIAEVVARPGLGKTSLLKKFTIANGAVFAGAIEYFVGSRAFPLSNATPEIAERFRQASGHNLLVIDEAEELESAATLAAINQLGTGPWTFSTLLGSRRSLGIGRVLDLEALDAPSFFELLKDQFGNSLTQETVRELWNAAQGNPLIAKLVKEALSARGRDSAATALELLRPWGAVGLVDAQGKEITKDSTLARALISDVRTVSDDLLEQLARDPSQLYKVTPRRFEEIVAELLQRRGYTVTLTPATRDGGKDMYAAKRDDLGSFLYIVECKRNSPERPVGVGVIRALHGIAQQEKVTASMLMTTSFFSGPAKEFAESLKYQMSLKDYFDLRLWLGEYRRT